MSTYDDAMVGAYVDGELDPGARDAFERALAADPDLARRVEAQRRLRRALSAAFDSTLAEPLPDRLLRSTRGPVRDPGVVSLESRTKRAAAWRAPHWWAMAASLVVGVLIGRQVLAPQSDATFLAAGPDGVLATGALAEALSQQLAADRGGAVQIGLSFRATSGEYCRTFQTRGARAAQAGLACHGPEGWHLQIVEAIAPDTSTDGAMRQASSNGLTESVRRAVESSMAGGALDATAELAARDAGWR